MTNTNDLEELLKAEGKQNSESLLQVEELPSKDEIMTSLDFIGGKITEVSIA